MGITVIAKYKEKVYLDSVVVHGAQVEGSALRHVHADVVHAGDQVAGGGGQRALQRQARPHRGTVDEPADTIP